MDRLILLALLLVVSPSKADSNFDRYFNGAMNVYSQIDESEYSKEFSEKFTEFVKSSYVATKCSLECEAKGEKVGKQFVASMNVDVNGQ